LLTRTGAISDAAATSLRPVRHAFENFSVPLATAIARATTSRRRLISVMDDLPPVPADGQKRGGNPHLIGGLNDGVRVLDLDRVEVPSAIRAVRRLEDYYLGLLDKDKDDLFEFCLSRVSDVLEDWAQIRNAARAQWPEVAAVDPDLLEDDAVNAEEGDNGSVASASSVEDGDVPMSDAAQTPPRPVSDVASAYDSDNDDAGEDDDAPTEVDDDSAAEESSEDDAPPSPPPAPPARPARRAPAAPARPAPVGPVRSSARLRARR